MRVTSPSADSLLAEEPAFSKDCSRSWNTQMLGSWSKCKRITTLISFQSCNQGNQTLLAEATGSICRIHWNKACPSWFYLCAFVSWSMFPCFEPKNPLARGSLKKIISLRNYSESSYTYIYYVYILVPCQTNIITPLGVPWMTSGNMSMSLSTQFLPSSWPLKNDPSGSPWMKKWCRQVAPGWYPRSPTRS